MIFCRPFEAPRLVSFDMQNNLSSIIELTEEVESSVLCSAKHILETLGGGEQLTVNKKADNSLVTNLDVEVQSILIEKLGDLMPVVAEEDESSISILQKEKNYFLVDPIDGTSALKRFGLSEPGQVGFGPLVGIVKDNRIVASCFYHVPCKTLYTAVLGQGSFAIKRKLSKLGEIPAFGERRRLQVDPSITLPESAVLFYSREEEVKIVSSLRSKKLIETAYRFGSFASDSTRLAEGREQVQLQFSIHPWDLTSVLFAVEAGCEAILDPLGRAVPIQDWEPQEKNSVVVAPKYYMDELLEHIREI